MRILFLLVCFLGCFAAVSAQDTLSFPASWAGIYQGKLEIFQGSRMVQSVDMSIEILKIDSSTTGRYTFSLIYGSKSADFRPYELVPVQPERGIWKVDEKNGIAMESYLHGAKFLCWFVVQDNRILCTYEKQADGGILFEVISGPEKAVSTTGDLKQGEEEIPVVKTYPVAVYQRAYLQKQKN